MQGRPKKAGVLIRLSKNTSGLMPRIVVPEGQKTHAMEASPEKNLGGVNGLRLERLGTTPYNELLVQATASRFERTERPIAGTQRSGYFSSAVNPERAVSTIRSCPTVSAKSSIICEVPATWTM